MYERKSSVTGIIVPLPVSEL